MKLSLAVLALLSLPLLAQDESKPDAWKGLTGAMQKQVDDGHVSGVIGLIYHKGERVYYESFGQRVIEEDKAMTKDALFRIYSMTKPVVAVAAMALWEEGKFKLDDPIAKHLSEWEMATVTDGEKVVPAKNPITPRQLMTHSSGLTYGKQGLDLGRETTLDEFSKALAKRPLKFQPGTDYNYGYSTDLLGRYLEAVEGKTLDVILRERIFDRLGMKDTEFWVRKKDDHARIARVYHKGKEKGAQLKPAMSRSELLRKPARMMGGQGLVSTTEDYAKFCAMLLNGGELAGKRVLKNKTVDVIFENHLKDIGKVYGLGGIVDGKGRYSWGGAAGTRFWVDRSTESYGVFMIQTWGYSAPTFGVFRKQVERVLEKKTTP